MMSDNYEKERVRMRIRYIIYIRFMWHLHILLQNPPHDWLPLTKTKEGQVKENKHSSSLHISVNYISFRDLFIASIYIYMCSGQDRKMEGLLIPVAFILLSILDFIISQISIDHGFIIFEKLE